ncbi:hypothetical protein [Nocardioides limicola]|uniref:hypothetical protein n=1 Tax=Nocardioides limicola TaxID=2803368 RepID=UPI00193C3001|nr:hypothetical protein [Nocardioides sp. DJM-14]
MTSDPDQPTPTTGVPAVDAVLADVEAAVTGPVAEHVQVFERAHEVLRRSLDPATADQSAATD